MLSVGWAEFFIYVVPITAGVIGGKYLGRLATFFLMFAALYAGVVLLTFPSRGEFLGPVAFLGGFFISPGGLVPLLIFVLVAGRASKGSTNGQQPKSPDQKFGCRMDSARRVSDSEREEIAAKVEKLGPWFHNYEIASGIWTNPSGQFQGIEYPLERWRLIEPLLPDVKGKSCLDVGCSSGFFSLKLKELGAAYVLGLDCEQQPKGIEQARFAAATLGLDIDFRLMSAYDLATLDTKFDVVLFMGVFYHLRHPLVALEAVRAVCAETMIFQTITTSHQRNLSELDAEVTRNVHLHSPTMTDSKFPAFRFVGGTLDGDVTCWFVPNIQAVAAVLRSCGFEINQTVFTNERDIIVRCTAVER